MAKARIAVIGAGSYGTCLAMLFGNAGHRVSLYCRNPQQAAELQEGRINRMYLPAYRLPEAVTVSADLAATVYHCLGVDPHTKLTDRTGRPHALCEGTPIQAILR